MTAAGDFARLAAAMRNALVLTLTSVLLACGGGDDGSSFGGMTQPGITTAPAGTETSTGESSSSSSASESSSSTTVEASTGTGTSEGMVWDMGMPDFGPTQPAGCKGKIDFLFVVSSGGTMQTDQKRLKTSLPGFMDAIQAQLPDFDYHILSANTDKSWAIEDCSICTEGCDPQGMLPYCSAAVTACDKKIGAGVIFPTGLDASNRLCDIDSDLRYITTGQKNLDEVFACTAQVGTYGSSIAGEAMVAALQPEINDPEDQYACNRGFLRKDALLVVTIIQDVYDEDSTGTVDEWIKALRAAKDFDDDAFAVLVLTTDIDVGYDQLCYPDDFNGNKNRLRLLAEGVENGFIGSICQDEFNSFFAEHVSALVDLCDDFIPPG
jgi:hypothetical protein